MPFREDANTNGPLSPYAASKKAAEVLCYTYHYLYGIDITIPRYFTVYGPAGRPDMSLFRFVQWISKGDPVTLVSRASPGSAFINWTSATRPDWDQSLTRSLMR